MCKHIINFHNVKCVQFIRGASLGCRYFSKSSVFSLHSVFRFSKACIYSKRVLDAVCVVFVFKL